LLLCGGSLASAEPIFDGWAINIDGIFISFVNYTPANGVSMNNGGVGYNDGPVTAYIANGAFDAGSIDPISEGQTAGGTGLGQISVSLLGTGTHTVSLWIDHHLEFGNGPVFYNEYGTATGGLQPGNLDYTIDDPGYAGGTAYDQTAAVTAPGDDAVHLDNQNHLGNLASPGDVSMALSITYTIPDTAFGAKWRFFLNYSGADYLQPGFFLPEGFHLEQNSVDGAGTLYFSATVEDIPEPAGWSLGAGGALMLAAMFFRRRQAAATR